MPNLINKLISDRYRIEVLLAEGGMGFIYKGTDIKENQPVAIKVLKEGASSSRIEDVIRFRREALAVSKLNHPNLIKIYEIGEDKGAHYIVMELVEGEGLDEYLKRSFDLKINEAAGIITQAAEALEAVHSAGIIHRDIKPGNILLNMEKTGPRVKVVDFGLSQIMELSQIKGKEAIVRTFGYMSPEQSGIIKKPVDERSDLYSLGIVFYQLLTNELPFKGEDVGSILHQQIAKQPVPPRQLKNEIPEIIEEMVLKLLKKDPSERYQTVKGLLADLLKYSQGEYSFILGREDRATKLTYRTHLIGREKELNQLRESYNNAAEGRGSICFIAGEAGRGKSRLIEELRSYVYEQGGEFIWGKSYAQQSKTPYQPFADASNEYLNRIKKLDPQEQQSHIDQMKKSLGELGETICRLNPLMQDVLGKVPELVKLDSQRDNRRFLMTCARFFCDLGIPGRPLVIALDDLQWADEGTLALFQELMEEIQKSHVLLLGMYRDNEVDAGHSLQKLINPGKEKQLPIKIVTLPNLDAADITYMLSELLMENEAQLQQLSSYIHLKSKGNPFFTLEVVRQLAHEEALTHDKQQWTVDWGKLEKISVSASILEILLKRISLLNREQIELFSTAAVIGKHFSLEMLYHISNLPREKVVNSIDQGAEVQLLEKGPGRSDALFVHDRIRDAFYHMMDRSAQKEYHLKIARALEELNKNNIENFLFDLAYHYSEAGNTDKTLQYAIPAADRAKTEYANEEAIKYYSTAIDILEEKKLKGSPDWVKCKDALADVCLTTGRNEETIQICQEIIQFKKSPQEKAWLYRQMGSAYFKKSDWEKSEKALAQGLRILIGERIPTTKLGVRIALLKELLVHSLHSLFPWFFMHREGKPVRSQDVEAIWCYEALVWMYIFIDIIKWLRANMRALNLAESRLGKSRELGMTYGAYGVICMSLSLFDRSKKYHEKGLAIRRELHDEWGIAQNMQFYGFYHLWRAEYQKGIDFLIESSEKFLQIGDLWNASMGLGSIGGAYRLSGDYTSAMQWLQKYLEVSRKIKNESNVASALESIGACYAEMGDFEEARKWIKNGMDISREKKFRFNECTGNLRIGYLELKEKNLEKAEKYFLEARELDQTNNFLKNYTVHLYPGLADTYIEKFNAAAGTPHNKARRRELNKIKKACRKALQATRHWQSHAGNAQRVYAKYLSLAKKLKESEKYFLSAIKHAEKIKSPYQQIEALYEYGLLLKQLNREEEAKTSWKKARLISEEIGAKAYARKTADILNLVPKTEKTAQKRLSDELELASVISVSHYLSSILDLNALLEKIMDISIEVSGAEKGYIFLYPQEKEKVLQICIARDVNKSALKEEDFAVSQTVIKQVEKEQSPRMVVDASQEESLKNQKSVIKHGLRSILCAPLITRDKMLGIVYLDNRLVGGLFTKEKLEVLITLLAQAAISIENARATEQLKNMQAQLQKHASTLEEKVKERTVELQEKLSELKEFHDLAVGRELRMIELEGEVGELESKLGKDAKPQT